METCSVCKETKREQHKRGECIACTERERLRHAHISLGTKVMAAYTEYLEELK